VKERKTRPTNDPKYKEKIQRKKGGKGTFKAETHERERGGTQMNEFRRGINQRPLDSGGQKVPQKGKASGGGHRMPRNCGFAFSQRSKADGAWPKGGVK